jgi:hypothetical protein
MNALKLFISHSSHTNENLDILDRVCEALQDDFKVLVDKEILPNEEWFPCLYEYMNECHGAVILLSNKALESDWVRAEAAILGNRRRMNAKFKLILIPLDGLAIEQIDKQSFFKAISITDFQAIRDCQTTAEIITKLSEALQDFKSSKPPSTPLEKMTNQVQDVLIQIQKKNPEAFLVALQEGLNKINSEFESSADNLADGLVRVLLRDPQKIFDNIKLLFEELYLLIEKSEANKIMDIVKGHWVHPEAAVLLSNARAEQQPVAINGRQVDDFSGDCYARKAWPVPTTYKLVTVNQNERGFPQIEQALLSQVPPQTMADRLKKPYLDKFPDPLILVFPFPDSNSNSAFPDEFLLEEIKTKLKNVTVIISTGEKIPEHLHYVNPLTPLLTQQLEDDQYLSYTFVNQYVDQHLKS